MTLQAFEATKKLCRRSDWSISNLELQKHLFLAQLAYMSAHEGRLLNVAFEAWDYGPVVPEVYQYVKRFGAAPIQNIFHSVNYPPRPEDEFLYSSFDRYKSRSAGQLVALTHRPGGAWDINFQRGMNALISDQDIRREARRGRSA